jgi:hypothetical protein
VRLPTAADDVIEIGVSVGPPSVPLAILTLLFTVPPAFSSTYTALRFVPPFPASQFRSRSLSRTARNFAASFALKPAATDANSGFAARFVY